MKDIKLQVELLLGYGQKHKLIGKLDTIIARNAILNLLKISEPYSGDIGKVQENFVDDIDEILEPILDYAYENGLMEENTVTCRDLFEGEITAFLAPRQSEVENKFSFLENEVSIEAATDNFHEFSKATNYIKVKRINKNLYWKHNSKFGDIEITVNLSKPEKDPKEIAKAKASKSSNYPKCLLCIENIGYSGHLNHPSRQNHRIIPLMLNNEEWYFQYSPYAYYNEHCIVLKGAHDPMKIDDASFVKLFDFVSRFPHYFVGSNADLPIVGGSILTHDHFQGGRHKFPMEMAKSIKKFTSKEYKSVECSIIKWPMSVIRLSSKDREMLTCASRMILKKWREYSDESVEIYAYSGETPHNTITPIVRINDENQFEIDLVLRNNRTSEKHPYGIFHPHLELHHIKKENIGLIEVMGLAVLPGRLEKEIAIIKEYLTGEKNIEKDNINSENPIFKHKQWIEDMIKEYSNKLSEDEALNVIRESIGEKFVEVLTHSGVFKSDDKGQAAFERFLKSIGFLEVIK